MTVVEPELLRIRLTVATVVADAREAPVLNMIDRKGDPFVFTAKARLRQLRQADRSRTSPAMPKPRLANGAQDT